MALLSPLHIVATVNQTSHESHFVLLCGRILDFFLAQCRINFMYFDFERCNCVLAPMEAPQDVNVSFVDYQSVMLTWRGVYTTINEEPLEGYIVCIRISRCILDVPFGSFIF